MRNCSKRLILLFLILASARIIYADTYYVEKSGDDSNSGRSEKEAFLTINHAFLFVRDGDTVLIGEGVFTISRPLEWMGSLIIKGKGAEKTIIQASEEPDPDKNSIFSYSVFYNQKYFGCGNVEPVSILSGVTIQHGDAPRSEPIPTSVGGGVKNFGSLTITGCIIQHNRALDGGAIYNAGELRLVNTVVRRNHAWNTGGAVWNAPSAVFSESGCYYENNTCDSCCINKQGPEVIR